MIAALHSDIKSHRIWPPLFNHPAQISEGQRRNLFQY
jgi:hypothetical protein